MYNQPQRHQNHAQQRFHSHPRSNSHYKSQDLVSSNHQLIPKTKKKKESINLITPASDLPLPPGLHIEQTQLLHRRGKNPKKPTLILREAIHERSRNWVTVQAVVGFEHAQTLWKVLEVHIVELVRSHDVVEDGKGRVGSVIGASFG